MSKLAPSASAIADLPRCPDAPASRFPRLAEVLGYLNTVRGRVDLHHLARLLGDLTITRADIDGVCQFGDRCYKRNTIARSEWYELLALCWRSGHVTPIHDHTGSSCAFRVDT